MIICNVTFVSLYPPIATKEAKQLSKVINTHLNGEKKVIFHLFSGNGSHFFGHLIRELTPV